MMSSSLFHGPNVYLSGDQTYHDSWWNERSLIEQAFEQDDNTTVLYFKNLDVTAIMADHISERIQNHCNNSNDNKEDWIKLNVTECLDNKT